jgi:hypothetical protein
MSGLNAYVWTEKRGGDSPPEVVRSTNFVFWEIQHTVVNGTKDRKSVFNITSE